MKIENLHAQAYDTVLITGIYHPEKECFYAMSNGGMLNVVNLQNELVYHDFLEDTTATWAHATYQRYVYGVSLRQSGQGFLWQFDTASQILERVIDLPDQHQAWSLAVLDDKNIYIGTYKEQDAAVFHYDGKHLSQCISFKDQYSYVRSLGISNDSLYIGTGQNGRVLAYHLKTRDLRYIDDALEAMIEKPLSELSFTYDMYFTQGYLFCRLDQSHQDVFAMYHEKSETWRIVKDKKAGMFNQLATDSKGVYTILDGTWHYVHLDALVVKDLQIAHQFDPRGICLKDDHLITLGRDGSLYSFSLQTKDIITKPSTMKPLPVILHNLGQDALGNLYISSYPGGPKLIQNNGKENREIVFPQVEGFAHDEHKHLYLGSYPGAHIYKLNIETLAYEHCFNLKDTYQQDRPYIMKYIDKQLYIGTIPDYKQRGGVLAIYDPKKKTKKVYRKLIKNQSIVGIAKLGQYLYLSSTIRGGLDSPWPKEKPKIIKFDLEKEKVIKEKSLTKEGFSGKIMISALTLYNDLLWCVSDGTIFALDLNSLEIIKTIEVVSGAKDVGMWKPYQLIHFKNDQFITDLAGAIHLVNLKTNEIKQLVHQEQRVSFIQYVEPYVYFLDKDDKNLKRIMLKNF